MPFSAFCEKKVGGRLDANQYFFVDVTVVNCGSAVGDKTQEEDNSRALRNANFLCNYVNPIEDIVVVGHDAIQRSVHKTNAVVYKNLQDDWSCNSSAVFSKLCRMDNMY